MPPGWHVPAPFPATPFNIATVIDAIILVVSICALIASIVLPRKRLRRLAYSIFEAALLTAGVTTILTLIALLLTHS